LVAARFSAYREKQQTAERCGVGTGVPIRNIRLDGRQYITVAAADTLWAFYLQ
jgi:hypothetical protein